MPSVVAPAAAVHARQGSAPSPQPLSQQIPPTQVITGMAIVMSIYIMMPVGLQIYHESKDFLMKSVAAR